MKLRRKFARRAVAATVAAFALVLTACSGTGGEPSDAGESGGTLKVQYYESFGSADPQVLFTALAYSAQNPTHVGLMGLPALSGAEGTLPVPALAAEEPTTPDGGITWEFKLRDDVKFSNGEPFTAADVEYSIIRLFKLAGGASFYLADLPDYEKCTSDPENCTLENSLEINEDENTVTFTLTRPNGLFAQQLVPVYMVPSSTPMEVQNTVPGTGPYAWTANDEQHATLERNEYYTEYAPEIWPEANPDKIEFTFGADPDTEFTAVLNNDQDWTADDASSDRLNEANSVASDRLHINPKPQVIMAAMNVNIPPFDKLEARQAVNFAMDRSALVTLAGGEAVASPQCQIIPSSAIGYEPYCPYTADASADGTGEWTGQDMERAKQLVEESGSVGAPVEVVTADTREAMAQQIVKDLNEAGFDASVKVLAANAAYSYQQNSDNNVQISISSWQSVFGGGLVFTNLLSCSAFHPGSTASPNLSGYCNEEIDALADEALETSVTDMDAAAKLMAEIDRRLTDEAAWAPMYNPNDVELVSERVGNYIYNPLYQFLFAQATVN